MGKQAPKTLKPHEIESFARQQNRMNNPNVSNPFGTTTTTFGPDDQASIVQQFDPGIQSILDSQQQFVSQGPAQLGNFSNPFIESMMQGNSNGIARRGGYAPSDVSQMGGYSGFSPQFNPGQQVLAQDLGANPGAPMNLPGVGNGISLPNVENAPVEQSPRQAMAQALGGAISQMGGGTHIDPYSQMGQNLAGFLQQHRLPPSPNDRSV